MIKRSIKFRAWVDGKKVYPVADVTNNLHEMPTDTLFEQFIGLTDKDSTEIYEGDYIRRRNYVYLVKWDNSEARFAYVSVGRFSKGWSGLIEKTDQYFITGFFAEDARNVSKVIGNMHETVLEFCNDKIINNGK